MTGRVPTFLVDAAPWVALGAVALALVVSGWQGWRAWQAWQRTNRTRQAATALLDVHQERLDEAVRRAEAQMGALSQGGEALAESLAGLRADVTQLRWLLGQVPEQRERLRRELIDTLLPTGARDA